MSNPLLEQHLLPPFSRISAADVEPAIDELLDRNRKRIAELTESSGSRDWDSLVAVLEQLNDELSQAWAPVSHLNSVMNSDELREAYNRCLPKLSEYWTELGQNQALYHAYQALADSEAYNALSQAQKTAIDHALRDFRLSGIALPEAEQKRYAELQKRLSELTTKFSENVLDATQGWYKHVTDESQLAGFPEHAVSAAREAAQERELEGWVITLDFPAYYAVMTHAEDRSLREELYRAYSTRASDQGPMAGQWDNSAIMTEILDLRVELAKLLGFNSYADYSLATKMAQTPDQVIGFIEDLAAKSRAMAEQELGELKQFALEIDGLDELCAWDLTYYGEKLKLARFDISQQALRPYFPLPKVLEGLFAVAGRLFDVQFEQVHDFDSWHKDARLYRLSRDGEAIAYCYLDPFARAKKRGGAWMADCRVRRKLENGSTQLPVAFLVCNFTPPTGDQPALLTHDEVTTLFHEFGHGLHHMLTKIDCADVSGINGVAWDAVELPSQFLENWCWEPQALALISGHHETGEPLPQEMLDKMLAAKHFQSGMMMLRQLEFALFDFRLHHEYQPGQTDVQQVLDQVRNEVAVFQPPRENRFQHGFSHIFAGGYAAGYYSYKWAEVLSADAFSRFEEEGIFNPDTGRAFREAILEQGGSREPMELFVNFRGREPKVDALLRHSGIQ
ncbi:oligopeptidase A [Marinobacterium litorale]|uniref:oligopeptidase A n=1 Tax=Marinobacterium litorale TaxID=404770 RepID=UPI00040D6C92|nr:oligopeptidase A [Marinobacterium litorale]